MNAPKPKVQVRRVDMPRFGLFGAERWWEVRLTPWQTVAETRDWAAAMILAHRYARAIRGKGAES